VRTLPSQNAPSHGLDYEATPLQLQDRASNISGSPLYAFVSSARDFRLIVNNITDQPRESLARNERIENGKMQVFVVFNLR